MKHTTPKQLKKAGVIPRFPVHKCEVEDDSHDLWRVWFFDDKTVAWVRRINRDGADHAEAGYHPAQQNASVDDTLGEDWQLVWSSAKGGGLVFSNGTRRFGNDGREERRMLQARVDAVVEAARTRLRIAKWPRGKLVRIKL